MLIAVIIGFCYKNSINPNDSKRMFLPGIIIDLYQIYNMFLKIKPDKLMVITDIEEDVTIDIVLEAIKDSKIDAHILSFIKKLKESNNYFQFISKDKLLTLFKENLSSYNKIFIYYTGHVENGSILLPIYSEFPLIHKILVDSTIQTSLMNIIDSKYNTKESFEIIPTLSSKKIDSTKKVTPKTTPKLTIDTLSSSTKTIPKSTTSKLTIDTLSSPTPKTIPKSISLKKSTDTLSSTTKILPTTKIVPKLHTINKNNSEFPFPMLNTKSSEINILDDKQKLSSNSYTKSKSGLKSSSSDSYTKKSDDIKSSSSEFLLPELILSSIEKDKKNNINNPSSISYIKSESSEKSILISDKYQSSSKSIEEPIVIPSYREEDELTFISNFNFSIKKEETTDHISSHIKYVKKGLDDSDVTDSELLSSDVFLQSIIDNTLNDSEIMIIMDCCMSDGLKLPYILRDNVYRRNPNGNIEYAYHISKKILLITSTLPNENSIATKKGSIFTGIFCRNILHGKKFLIKLIETVQSETNKTYKQTPTIYVNNFSIKALFDFLFPGEIFKADWNSDIHGIELKYIN